MAIGSSKTPHPEVTHSKDEAQVHLGKSSPRAIPNPARYAAVAAFASTEKLITDNFYGTVAGANHK